MPSASMRSGPRISAATPGSAVSSAARSTSARGVSTLPGSLASSRAALMASPMTRPRSSWARWPSATSTEASRMPGSGSADLRWPWLKLASTTASAAAAVAASASTARPARSMAMVRCRRSRAQSAAAATPRRTASGVTDPGPVPTTSTRVAFQAGSPAAMAIARPAIAHRLAARNRCRDFLRAPPRSIAPRPRRWPAAGTARRADPPPLRRAKRKRRATTATRTHCA